MAGSLLLLLEAAASIGGTCYGLSYIFYKMVLRHKPRWTDRVFNAMNVPSVQ